MSKVFRTILLLLACLCSFQVQANQPDWQGISFSPFAIESFGKSLGELIHWYQDKQVPMTILPPEHEGFSENPAQLPSQVQALWRSVVRFEIDSQKSNFKGSQGSGVIVRQLPGTDYALIATNSHVVNQFSTDKRFKERIDQRFSFHAWIHFTTEDGSDEVSTDFQVVHDDPARDLALVQVRLPKGVTPPFPRLLPPTAKLEAPVPLFAVGFPHISSRKNWLNEKPANKDPNLKRFSRGVLRYVSNDPSAGTTISHDADLLPGNSGGAIFGTDGRLLGLVSKANYAGSGSHEYCSHILIRGAVMICPMVGISSAEIAAVLNPPSHILMADGSRKAQTGRLRK